MSMQVGLFEEIFYEVPVNTAPPEDEESEALLPRFLELAGRLWSEPVFARIPDGVLTQIEREGGSSWTVWGAHDGGTCELVVAESPEAYRTLQRMDWGTEVDDPPRLRALVNLAPGRYSPIVRAAVEARTWSAWCEREGRYPTLTVFDQPRVVNTPGPQDYEDVMWCVEALLAWANGLPGDGLVAPGERFEVEVEGSSVSVRLSGLDATTPEFLLDEHGAFDITWRPDPTQYDGERVDRFDRQLLARFGHSEAFVEVAGLGEPLVSLLTDVLYHGYEDRGLMAPDLTAEDIEALLLEVLPREAHVRELDGASLVPALGAFWAFLRQEYGLERPEIDALLARPGLGARVERHMFDPARFGPNKKASIRYEAEAAAAREAAREAAHARATRAHAPIRDEPKVGRNAPCPCGSGKKYKKCCLRKE